MNLRKHVEAMSFGRWLDRARRLEAERDAARANLAAAQRLIEEMRQTFLAQMDSAKKDYEAALQTCAEAVGTASRKGQEVALDDVARMLGEDCPATLTGVSERIEALRGRAIASSDALRRAGQDNRDALRWLISHADRIKRVAALPRYCAGLQGAMQADDGDFLDRAAVLAILEAK